MPYGYDFTASFNSPTPLPAGVLKEWEHRCQAFVNELHNLASLWPNAVVSSSVGQSVPAKRPE